MWIKICGMTTPDAIATALEAGVDAIGFVFADSPRQVTPEAAAQLARPARGRVRCVAVMRHPAQPALDEMLRVFRPDVLQTDESDLAALHLPAPPPPLAARILFEGPASGAGRASDWSAARRLARRTQLVLAGGLHSGNVAQAIAAVRPFGVDVSSGVEARPGVKNPLKIMQFVSAARESAAARPSEDVQ
jgi:phosphoribosylanthranilate isomerase